MAKTPAPAIDDDRLYKVDLTKSIRVGRSIINPGSTTRLRGDVLKSLLSSSPATVTSYEAV